MTYAGSKNCNQIFTVFEIIIYFDSIFILFQGDKKFILAVSLHNGYVYLLSTFDDVAPIHINTGLQGPLCMEWSNSRELLAVAGIILKSPTQTEYTNMLKFYTDKGILLYQTLIPDTQVF